MRESRKCSPEVPETTGAGELRTATRERYPEEGVGVLCPGGARPPRAVMVRFVDRHRATHGVEPICRVVGIAPVDVVQTAGARRGAALRPEITRVWEATRRRYGAKTA